MIKVRWDLLEGLSKSQIGALLEHASPQRLKEGDRLFSLGEDAEASFLVIRGKMRLTLPVVVGGMRLDVTVGEREDGQMLGWSGLIPPHRFTVEASAVTETDLFRLDRRVLSAAFAERPDEGYIVYANLARIVGQRLQVFQAMWVREIQHVISADSP